MEIQSMNEKTPARVYETTLYECSCPDWKYRKSVSGGLCKHQEQLMGVLIMDTLSGKIQEYQRNES